MAGKPLLQVDGVETYYGNIRALNGVDRSTSNEGEIVALIGANGAGKSTLMMTIFGSPRARTGTHHLRRHGHHQDADARDRAAAHRAVAGRPPHLPAHDGAWKTCRWAPASTTSSTSTRTSRRSSRCFRA